MPRLQTPAERDAKRSALALISSLPAGAAVAGKGYEEAYALVYGTALRARLAEIVAEYGAEVAGAEFEDGGISWELGKFGWTPAALLAAIDSQEG